MDLERIKLIEFVACHRCRGFGRVKKRGDPRKFKLSVCSACSGTGKELSHNSKMLLRMHDQKEEENS